MLNAPMAAWTSCLFPFQPVPAYDGTFLLLFLFLLLSAFHYAVCSRGNGMRFTPTLNKNSEQPWEWNEVEQLLMGMGR